MLHPNVLPIGGRVDKASAIETADLGSIPGRVKSQLSCLTFTNKKQNCESSTVCVRQVAACLEDRKVPSLSPDQGNFKSKLSLFLLYVIHRSLF